MLKELELSLVLGLKIFQGTFRINYKEKELPSVMQQHCAGAAGKNAVHEFEPLIYNQFNKNQLVFNQCHLTAVLKPPQNAPPPYFVFRSRYSSSCEKRPQKRFSNAVITVAKPFRGGQKAPQNNKKTATKSRLSCSASVASIGRGTKNKAVLQTLGATLGQYIRVSAAWVRHWCSWGVPQQLAAEADLGRYGKSNIASYSCSLRGRFVHLLVWLFNVENVRVTFGCHRRLMPQYVMDFLVEVGEAGSPCGSPVAAALVCIAEPLVSDAEMEMDNSKSDSDYAASFGSSSDCQEGGERILDTSATGHPRYILPALPPIPRLADMPCLFQQFHLDEGASVDLLKAGMGNDYNTDGGAELRVGHWILNWEAVQTTVKNYSIWRNAEYRVVESD
ncbi:hypothetical protein PIB30_054734 [Stylosanthes scabra]|uniref:Uncharacterized protein n=1 Tax=Stylosanthes scabra TaxID=79078 RepID=A0ABU6SIR5_9FABA|nr:hypothetical protein [Stylosanthes scabra]